MLVYHHNGKNVPFNASMSVVPSTIYLNMEPAFFMRKGKIEERKPGIWQRTDRKIFFTCPFCTAINRVGTNPSRYRYKSGGSTADSVWCHKCQRHLRLYYEPEGSKHAHQQPR